MGSSGSIPDPSNQPRPIWFELLNYEKTSIGYEKVRLPPSSDVADFRQIVQAFFSNHVLKGIPTTDLLVYKNRESFESNQVNTLILYLFLLESIRR